MKTKAQKKISPKPVVGKSPVNTKPTTRACKKTTKSPKAKTQRITFSVRAEKGSQVFLAGSFNNWDPNAKEMTDKNDDGLFVVTIALAQGTYQYKFVIDGTWCADPDCADWVQNEHGTLNSVKQVV